MANVGFSFQDTDLNGSSSGGKSWLVIGIVVTLVTVGVIMLIRAFDNGDNVVQTPSNTEKPTVEKTNDNGTVQKTEPKKETAPTASAQPGTNKTDIPAAPEKPASPKVQSLMQAAEKAEKEDNISAARTNYLEVLADSECGGARDVAEARLGIIDIDLIFTPREMPGKVDYAIAAGDSLKKIANKFGTTVDLIVKGNNVANPDRVQVGDRLRVLDKQVFAIAVSKSRNDLLVTMNGKFFKRYRVATGKFAKTPVGTFKIEDKIPDPPWWRPDGKVIPFGDKENILGTRWMAIAATGDTPPAKGYGIHGTWDDSSIGSQASAGCIRMKNSDVEELFTYIPLGTSVTITE